ncbi:solute carrier family member 38, putative [Ichthyophthirius multifiliis]|uniref:Solute carrier family member 38, putative n=1 Tax=Ichthyophthirius multifiliis TaxID=5932 RepID=G0QMV0_ICHMU|nr:solute carrier family member 38, putative [Ichthyophthirius multifiliis]EGR33460.1 solute carrier family member 38, putative [Ichthyophthirius multifiliis]|eukprot:XP_004037446.1 solute carrier family member 38, putative [Ichthyophthirius multifiliis]
MEDKNSIIKAYIHYKSFIAGACFTLISQPFEVMRTSSVFLNYRGIYPSELWSIMKYIYRKEGIKGYFRGGTICLLKSSFGLGIFFNGITNLPLIMHTLPKQPEKYIYNGFVNFFNGSVAMLFTTLFTTPLTVLKTRFEVIGQNEYKNIIQAAQKIYIDEGLKGFYRGIGPMLMRDLPFSGAISATIAIIIYYPFDNIRVRYQGVRGESKSYFNLVRFIYIDEGLQGFYRGFLPRMLKKGAQGAIAWTIYEYLKKDNLDKKQLQYNRI